MKSYKILDFDIILMFSVIFLYLLALNIFLPPQADDIQAAINAKDGINSAIKSYMSWNARIGELLFVGFIAGFSDLVFDFINAAVGTIFIYVFFVFVFARSPKSDDKYCILLICFLMLYFAPFGAVFLWGSGSLNYMWGILFIIIALLPYRIFWDKILNNTNKLSTINSIYPPPFLIINLFAGMASEQLGIIIILCHIVFGIYAFKKGIKLEFWYYTGVIFFIIGYLFLYFSPGHAHRASMSILKGQFLKIDELLALSFSEKLNRVLLLLDYSITNIFKIFILLIFFITAKLQFPKRFRLFYLAFILLIAVLIFICDSGFILHLVSVMILLSLPKDRIYKIIFVLYIIYLFLCLSGIQILVLPPRARLGEILVLISVFCIFYKNIHNTKVLNICIFVCCVAYSSFVAIEYYKFYNRWNEMLTYIESQKQIGNYDVVVENIFVSKYPNFIDSLLPTDIALESPNPLYAHKFGLKSFRVDDYYKDN